MEDIGSITYYRIDSEMIWPKIIARKDIINKGKIEINYVTLYTNVSRANAFVLLSSTRYVASHDGSKPDKTNSKQRSRTMTPDSHVNIQDMNRTFTYINWTNRIKRINISDEYLQIL